MRRPPRSTHTSRLVPHTMLFRSRPCHHRRTLRAGSGFGYHSGLLLQANRKAGIQDGADPPSFRTAWLVGAHRRNPFLDHLHRPCPCRPFDIEIPVIVSPAFAGKKYAVLGLARSGMATVEALGHSAAHVIAWDNREDARQAMEMGRASGGEGGGQKG